MASTIKAKYVDHIRVGSLYRRLFTHHYVPPLISTTAYSFHAVTISYSLSLDANVAAEQKLCSCLPPRTLCIVMYFNAI